MTDAPKPLHVVALGTYDRNKPRTRILLRGLSENGVQLTECHRDVWGGTEDKSQISGIADKFHVLWRYLIAYPVLICRYLRCRKHDAVLIGYLGLFDVLVLWPFVRLRRAILIWDVFLSLYDTVVEDRKMIRRRNPVAMAMWAMEWSALRLVDKAIIDTQAHADHLCRTYHCSGNRVARVFLGVEPEPFDLARQELLPADPNERPKRIVFYGQFIPLHGIEFIVRAAKKTEKAGLQWLLIGKGQQTESVRSLIDRLQPENLEWIEWVEYSELAGYLAASHIALGIFGTTGKAQRVIPNKVFQILMAGRPLITADTPAIRELVSESDQVRLVPAGDASALARAALEMGDALSTRGLAHRELLEEISPGAIGLQLKALICEQLQA
jgi:glycosyltransferase involved in cell wall biosynthesis